MPERYEVPSFQPTMPTGMSGLVAMFACLVGEAIVCGCVSVLPALMREGSDNRQAVLYKSRDRELESGLGPLPDAHLKGRVMRSHAPLLFSFV